MLRQSEISPSLRAGDLCHQVKFARASAAPDSFGQPQNVWTPYLTTRAKVQNLSGQQLYQANTLTSQAIWRVTVRWPGAGVIQSGDRCLFQAHVFAVQIVNNLLERGRVLELTCLEINGAS